MFFPWVWLSLCMFCLNHVQDFLSFPAFSLAHMARPNVSFRLLYEDGTPAKNHRIILKILGRNSFGLTDFDGLVQFPFPPDEGLVKVFGKSVYYGMMDIDEIIISLN